MAGITDTINAILRRSGVNPNAGSRPAVAPEDFATTQQQPGQLEAPVPAAPAEVAAGGDTGSAAPAGRPPLALPYRGDTQDSLERMQNTRAQFEYDLQELFRIRGEAGSARAAATTSGARQRATDEYNEADNAVRQMQAAIAAQDTRITAEENRRRDEKKTEDAKEPKPKNGDERWVPIETKDAQGRTIRGLGKEVYENGVWKYQPGSAKADTGFGSGPQGPGTPPTVLTDGRGAYWTFDPVTGKASPLNGPAAGIKTIADPANGAVYLQNPDGSLGRKLFDGQAQTITDNGFVVGIDKRNGAEVFRTDVKTPEGRALADRLERATVEAAENANQPKFGSAVAQYQQEVSRRQGLARTELTRLQDLQRSGQLSPEQAEKQFDTWMATNVEGPLSGFRRAAEEERRTQEQANVTRSAAEKARVQEFNRARATAGYEAGEAGRQLAMTTNAGVRSRGFISDLGGLASSLAQGKTDFQFNPSDFDPANFKSEMADVDQIANQAMQRLFGLVPEATENQVNAPLPALPTGDELRGLMGGIKYSGPLTGAPNETPLIGAQDLGPSGQPGMARTVYSNGRFLDWQIPPDGAAAAPGAIPQVAPPTVAPPALPGQQEGETPEQRQARWKAILAR